MSKSTSLETSFSQARVELLQPDNDFQQRMRSSASRSCKALPDIGRSHHKPRPHITRSTNSSPKANSHSFSRDISFIEHTKADQSRIVNPAIFDQKRIEEFARPMLDSGLTAMYSLLPSHGLGKPACRRDAETLAEWVGAQEEELVKVASATELFEKAQEVYGSFLVLCRHLCSGPLRNTHFISTFLFSLAIH